MTLDSEEELRERIAEGQTLRIIHQTTGVPFSRLQRIRDALETASEVVAGGEVVTTDEALGVVVDASSRDRLGGEMDRLGSAIVESLSDRIERGVEEDEMAGIVRNLCALREAFFGKGTFVQVNQQTNVSGARQDGRSMLGRAKR